MEELNLTIVSNLLPYCKTTHPTGVQSEHVWQFYTLTSLAITAIAVNAINIAAIVITLKVFRSANAEYVVFLHLSVADLSMGIWTLLLSLQTFQVYMRHHPIWCVVTTILVHTLIGKHSISICLSIPKSSKLEYLNET